MNVVVIIVAITSIVSVIAFQNRDLLYRLMMRPYDVEHNRQYYRLITSGLIHIDWTHLVFNMFVLYTFGLGTLGYYRVYFNEKYLVYFLVLYIGGIIFSDLPSMIKHRNDPAFSSLGASGAVSAVLFAYLFFDPLGKVYVFGLLELPGFVWGIVYLAYTVYMSRRGGDNINHDAHLFGALYGVIFTLAMKPVLALHFIQNIQTVFQR